MPFARHGYLIATLVRFASTDFLRTDQGVRLHEITVVSLPQHLTSVVVAAARHITSHVSSGGECIDDFCSDDIVLTDSTLAGYALLHRRSMFRIIGR